MDKNQSNTNQRLDLIPSRRYVTCILHRHEYFTNLYSLQTYLHNNPSISLLTVVLLQTIHDADDDDNDNVVLDDDNDDVHDVQVLASRLSTHHRRNTSRRHVEDVIHDEIIEDDWRPGHDDDDMDLDDDDDDDFDFDRNGNGRQSRQRAVRRNRPRGARQRDNHLGRSIIYFVVVFLMPIMFILMQYKYIYRNPKS